MQKNTGVLTFAVQFSSGLTFLKSRLSYDELARHPAPETNKFPFRVLLGHFIVN